MPSFSNGSGLRPSVNQIRKLGNFTQMFRWAIELERVPDKLSSLIPTNYGNGRDASSAFNIRAMSATVPEKTGTSTEIQIRGNKVRQPGLVEYTSPFTCTLYETNDVWVQQLLWAWHNLYWDTNLRNTQGDSSGLTEFKADLEGIIKLTQLNNLDQPIYEYRLIGAYIESYSRGDFSESAADPMQPNISFAFDYFTENIVNNGEANQASRIYSDSF